jgi:hypothetical protein
MLQGGEPVPQLPGSVNGLERRAAVCPHWFSHSQSLLSAVHSAWRRIYRTALPAPDQALSTGAGPCKRRIHLMGGGSFSRSNAHIVLPAT